jgi:uncharacterized protein (TIGR02466 family)
MDEVIPLFPVPLMRCPSLLSARLVSDLNQHFSGLATKANSSSNNLSHTELLKPNDSPLFIEAVHCITPKLEEFGFYLFGQRLGWSIKEMWVNVLDAGGRQAMHNHANSFASGIVYLTPVHSESRTVFMKSPGGVDFIFKNDHKDVKLGPFNADKWISPAPNPGDMVLFPSYLMHAVPPNSGERRISMAFNAIPTRLDSWGYSIGFNG